MPDRTRTCGYIIATVVVLGALACEHPIAPSDARQDGRPSLLIAAAGDLRMQGAGGIGSGQPTYYGVDHQWFRLDVGTSGGAPYGQLDYIDSGFVKEDGNFPHFVVGSSWPGTAVLSVVQTSDACVELDGVGHLINTGEKLAFRAQACDNGSPGVGVDSFGIEVPQRLITHGGVYHAGPAPLFEGELTKSGSGTLALTIP